MGETPKNQRQASTRCQPSKTPTQHPHPKTPSKLRIRGQPSLQPLSPARQQPGNPEYRAADSGSNPFKFRWFTSPYAQSPQDQHPNPPYASCLTIPVPGHGPSLSYRFVSPYDLPPHAAPAPDGSRPSSQPQTTQSILDSTQVPEQLTEQEIKAGWTGWDRLEAA